MLSTFKNHLFKLLIVVPIFLSIFMLVLAVLYVKSKERLMYNTENINVVEVRLPSVELEKYKQLDKIRE